MRRLAVVSNRLPVIIYKEDDCWGVREGAGGLVTALKPFLARQGGVWVGFAGMYDTERGTGWEPVLAESGGEGIRYQPLTPPLSLYEGYYLQYANQELWPRFHGLVGKMSRDAAKYWPDYVKMNQLFAEHTRQAAGEQSLIWIQDYHLMLLPQMLRETLPGAALGHFLHIPFPTVDIMRDQPHAREVLEGVLGADLLGFHIPAYMDNFLESAERIVAAGVVSRTETEATLEHNGRQVRLGAFPIGIQPAQLENAADTEAARQRLTDVAETIILSMDRLDYTKAIPPRLEAYGQLLDTYQEYRERISLVQLLDISRKDIPAYQQEREKVERIVSSVKERYPTWNSLFFEAERWPREQVAGLMRLARVCLVTPRCDGMNLVAKEYVAAAPDDGVLVLSHQAGAAWQFGDHAVMVDGESPASIVEGLRTALEMPADERRARMARLKENVRDEDVFWWADRFMDNLQVTEG